MNVRVLIAAAAALAVASPVHADPRPAIDTFFCGPVMLKFGGMSELTAHRTPDRTQKNDYARLAYISQYQGYAMDDFALKLDPAKSQAGWQASKSVDAVLANAKPCGELFWSLLEQGRITPAMLATAKAKSHKAMPDGEYDEAAWN
jgi:hypothetical protein